MSMSNRALRMAQHHLRNRADAQLNLIPLIDILSVMVAFLLVYSTEVEVIQNSKGIEIPQSIAQTAPEAVGRGHDHQDAICSCRVSSSPASPISAPRRARWSSRCARRCKRPLLVGKEMTEKDLAQREITIMADKAMPYDVLKRVMATCTDADYGRISLAVIQKEKPVAAGQFKPRLSTHMLLAPYYREYELPWEGDPEANERFQQDPARPADHPGAARHPVSAAADAEARRPPRTFRSAWRA